MWTLRYLLHIRHFRCFYYQIKGKSFVLDCHTVSHSQLTWELCQSIKHYWIIGIDTMIRGRVTGIKLNPQCLLFLWSQWGSHMSEFHFHLQIRSMGFSHSEYAVMWYLHLCDMICFDTHRREIGGRELWDIVKYKKSNVSTCYRRRYCS